MNLNKTWLERCGKIEDQSISAFRTFIENTRWVFERWATKQEDMHNHVDCFIKNFSGQKVAVDIKGLKREISQGRVLVELMNVQGKRGWLFGKADFLFFQVDEKGFVVVERNKLFQLAKKICGFDVFTKGGFNVAMKGNRVSNIADCNGSSWYCRNDRPKEKVVFLPLEEIKKIALTFQSQMEYK
jgi:hypothetical protein